jgi:hypothetical protein
MQAKTGRCIFKNNTNLETWNKTAILILQKELPCVIKFKLTVPWKPSVIT